MVFSRLTLLFASILLCSGWFASGQENAEMNIPESLLECYSEPELYERTNRIPMTISNFIALIRKVEMFKGSVFDIRTLSYTLLHRFRMDGVERNPDVTPSYGVVPFSPSGFQFAKHNILLSELIPGNGMLFPNESLSAAEKCALHFMLSSSVDFWQRRDEDNVCPYVLNAQVNNNYYQHHPTIIKVLDNPHTIKMIPTKMSRCPVEDGVVLTSRWGTVSPGNVIAGIASAMQPQDVEIKEMLPELAPEGDTEAAVLLERLRSLPATDTVQNTLAATIIGDLAEVVLIQGPRVQEMFMGPPVKWNDSSIPRVNYMQLPNSSFWEMTDAEIRGGIDGYILGNKVGSWSNTMNSLRLSQILEMYYSDEGVNFDTQFRVCNREANLNSITNVASLISETTNFARVLSYKLKSVQIKDLNLAHFSKNAVSNFQSYLPKIMKMLKCSTEKKSTPRIHLTVIMDGTWTHWEGYRLLAHLSEEIDVSTFGSSIAVVNGKRGTWLLNRTFNMTSLFSVNVTRNAEATWPTGLDLPLALEAVKNDLGEQQTSDGRRVTMPQVVVVLACSSTISDDHFSRTRQTMAVIKQHNPDLKFIFVTSEVYGDHLEELMSIDPLNMDVIIKSSDNRMESIVPKVLSTLQQVPDSITNNCNGKENTPSEFEDYITPGQVKQYRIHPNYISHVEAITMEFQSNGYGQLSACLSREQDIRNVNCTMVEGYKTTTTTLRKLCSELEKACLPVFMTVKVIQTFTKCTENDCRYPHQVRFLVRYEGVRCKGATVNMSNANHSQCTSIVLALWILLTITFVKNQS